MSFWYLFQILDLLFASQLSNEHCGSVGSISSKKLLISFRNLTVIVVVVVVVVVSKAA